MPRVGFEPTIPVFRRPKTFRALERAAPASGQWYRPKEGKEFSENHEDKSDTLRIQSEPRNFSSAVLRAITSLTNLWSLLRRQFLNGATVAEASDAANQPHTKAAGVSILTITGLPIPYFQLCLWSEDIQDYQQHLFPSACQSPHCVMDSSLPGAWQLNTNRVTLHHNEWMWTNA
jgi:hypothetical protein